MKRFGGLLVGFASLVLLSSLASHVQAALCAGDTVTVSIETLGLSGNWITENGAITTGYDDPNTKAYAGEILITNNATGESFKTFCLQLNVDITPYDPVNNFGSDGVYMVSGISNTPTGDIPLTNETKWLWCNYYYSNFNGSFDNPDPESIPMGVTATDVQEAIWLLQNNVGTPGSALTGISGTAMALYTFVTTEADVTGDPNIAALNLVTINFDGGPGDPTQSMLIMQPPESVILKQAPEPMSLAIWGGLSALGFVVAMRQRRLSAARAA